MDVTLGICTIGIEYQAGNSTLHTRKGTEKHLHKGLSLRPAGFLLKWKSLTADTMIPCEALSHLRLTIYLRLSAFMAAAIQARIPIVHKLCPFEHFQLLRRIKCIFLHINVTQYCTFCPLLLFGIDFFSFLLMLRFNICWSSADRGFK